jgi:hypothetical protein
VLPFCDTKTKGKQNVPLPIKIINELKELKLMNGMGLCFRLTAGVFARTTESVYLAVFFSVKNPMLDSKFHNRTCRIKVTHIRKNAA